MISEDAVTINCITLQSTLKSSWYLNTYMATMWTIMNKDKKCIRGTNIYNGKSFTYLEWYITLIIFLNEMCKNKQQEESKYKAAETQTKWSWRVLLIGLFDKKDNHRKWDVMSRTGQSKEVVNTRNPQSLA